MEDFLDGAVGRDAQKLVVEESKYEREPAHIPYHNTGGSVVTEIIQTVKDAVLDTVQV